MSAQVASSHEKPPKVFISYSRADREWLGRLQKHLKPYTNRIQAAPWSDENIQPGQVWYEEIKKAIAETKLAILLVSPDFLASDFIMNQEVPLLIEEARQGRIAIVWFLVRNCAYKETPLAAYQALVDPRCSLASLKADADQDDLLVNICIRISEALNLLKGISPPIAPPTWANADRAGEVQISSAQGDQNLLMPAATPQKSIAVLPFLNMNPDQENEFLCDGITEDLIMALSRLKGLRVPARTSSFAFKGKNEDIRHIGQLLNVETVLEGSVRKSGHKLRITAQLVKVRDGFHLWSERYDREMKDVFDIQDDITRAIVGELQVQLGGGSETQFVRRQTASTAAYELYVKGRVYWNWRGVDLKKALHYFELALLEDADYALAWSGMADAFVLLGFYDFLPCREALAKARSAAEKAIKLDEHSAEAHSALGVALLFHDWDSTRAKAELERAVQLNPGYSLARGWYSLYLAGEGRDEEALEQARLGVQGDPLSCFANAHLGWMHIILRRFDEAFLPLRRSLELHPNSAVACWLLGQACWFTGERETALAELQRAVDLSGRNPMKLSSLGWALALSGQTDRAREIQRELVERTTPASTRPLFLAVLHAAIGENDLAFATLERALAERELWLPLPRAIAGLTPLESDPRWPVFIGKVEAARRASSNAMPRCGSRV